MPTVLRVGPCQFYFYSHESTEPPHVHVDREKMSAKFWLQPISLAKNLGFRPVELRKIARIVANNRQHLLASWYAHLGNQRG
jgi:3-methyladenine DNA glycosylase AlkD